MWAKCICGSNGKPVSDGPYLMTNYTKGQGLTLKANPMWYGKKPAIKEVDFKLITDTNSEVQAIRGGEVDVAAPQPSTALASLRNASGVTYKVAPGNYLEHIDLQFGKKASNPLLRSPWMRQALMMGMNRTGLINAVFGSIAPGLKPLNSLVVFQADSRYKNYFNKWNYNPTKALALLKKHCTGGPSTPTEGNTSYFTCSGYPAKFAYTTTAGNSRRETSEAIFKANLAAIGIQITDNLLPASVMFGDTVLTAGNYDMMEFAWGGAVDPGSFGEIWGCGGGQNFLGYCDRRVNKYFDDAKTQLNAAKRVERLRASGQDHVERRPGDPALRAAGHRHVQERPDRTSSTTRPPASRGTSRPGSGEVAAREGASSATLRAARVRRHRRTRAAALFLGVTISSRTRPRAHLHRAENPLQHPGADHLELPELHASSRSRATRSHSCGSSRTSRIITLNNLRTQYHLDASIPIAVLVLGPGRLHAQARQVARDAPADLARHHADDGRTRCRSCSRPSCSRSCSA